MSAPKYWFLGKDDKGKIWLRFEYEDNPEWETGDTTDLDEQVLHVFSPEQDADVVGLLNGLYYFEEVAEGGEDIISWAFKATVEKIIRAAVDVVAAEK